MGVARKSQALASASASTQAPRCCTVVHTLLPLLLPCELPSAAYCYVHATWGTNAANADAPVRHGARSRGPTHPPSCNRSQLTRMEHTGSPLPSSRRASLGARVGVALNRWGQRGRRTSLTAALTVEDAAQTLLLRPEQRTEADVEFIVSWMLEVSPLCRQKCATFGSVTLAAYAVPQHAPTFCCKLSASSDLRTSLLQRIVEASEVLPFSSGKPVCFQGEGAV